MDQKLLNFISLTSKKHKSNKIQKAIDLTVKCPGSDNKISDTEDSLLHLQANDLEQVPYPSRSQFSYLYNWGQWYLFHIF